MLRITTFSAVGLFAALAAQAGTVQIGGASGITSNYILQGGGAVCAAGAGQCVTGSTTGWSEKNYNNILFGAATNNSGATSPSAFTGYVQTGGEPSGLTATDAVGTKFSMLSDGTANGQPTGNSNYYWESTATGGVTDSITVPIGVFGAADVWTMLNNQWGTVGGNDTSVTFQFGATSNATTGLTSVTVDLLNSPNNGATQGGSVRSVVACNTTTTATCNNSTNPHGILQKGVNAPVINGVTVNTSVVYNTFNYTAASPTGFYANTAGNLRLDDQQFIFGSEYAGLWLVDMIVTENVSNTPASVTGSTLPSETALTAITVDTVVPEPTTVLLSLGGLAILGFRRFRRS